MSVYISLCLPLNQDEGTRLPKYNNRPNNIYMIIRPWPVFAAIQTANLDVFGKHVPVFDLCQKKSISSGQGIQGVV